MLPKKFTRKDFFRANLKGMDRVGRWQAVCDESRTHGLERGKIPRENQRITYRYQITKTAMRVVGGGSVALAAATFVNQTTGMLIP